LGKIGLFSESDFCQNRIENSKICFKIAKCFFKNRKNFGKIGLRGVPCSFLDTSDGSHSGKIEMHTDLSSPKSIADIEIPSLKDLQHQRVRIRVPGCQCREGICHGLAAGSNESALQNIAQRRKCGSRNISFTTKGASSSSEDSTVYVRVQLIERQYRSKQDDESEAKFCLSSHEEIVPIQWCEAASFLTTTAKGGLVELIPPFIWHVPRWSASAGASFEAVFLKAGHELHGSVVRFQPSEVQPNTDAKIGWECVVTEFDPPRHRRGLQVNIYDAIAGSSHTDYFDLKGSAKFLEIDEEQAQRLLMDDVFLVADKNNSMGSNAHLPARINIGMKFLCTKESAHSAVPGFGISSGHIAQAALDIAQWYLNRFSKIWAMVSKAPPNKKGVIEIPYSKDDLSTSDVLDLNRFLSSQPWKKIQRMKNGHACSTAQIDTLEKLLNSFTEAVGEPTKKVIENDAALQLVPHLRFSDMEQVLRLKDFLTHYKVDENSFVFSEINKLELDDSAFSRDRVEMNTELKIGQHVVASTSCRGPLPLGSRGVVVSKSDDGKVDILLDQPAQCGNDLDGRCSELRGFRAALGIFEALDPDVDFPHADCVSIVSLERIQNSVGCIKARQKQQAEPISRERNQTEQNEIVQVEEKNEQEDVAEAVEDVQGPGKKPRKRKKKKQEVAAEKKEKLHSSRPESTVQKVEVIAGGIPHWMLEDDGIDLEPALSKEMINDAPVKAATGSTQPSPALKATSSASVKPLKETPKTIFDAKNDLQSLPESAESLPMAQPKEGTLLLEGPTEAGPCILSNNLRPKGAADVEEPEESKSVPEENRVAKQVWKPGYKAPASVAQGLEKLQREKQEEAARIVAERKAAEAARAAASAAASPDPDAQDLIESRGTSEELKKNSHGIFG
jgi:hypothetical protein